MTIELEVIIQNWNIRCRWNLNPHLCIVCLSKPEKHNCNKYHHSIESMHTVSFDWFLSGLEWIIYLEFCYYNFCYFTSKYYRISDLGLTFPQFEFSSLYLDIFDQNLHFLCKNLQFWPNISKYRPKNSKCGRLKPRSDIP